MTLQVLDLSNNPFISETEDTNYGVVVNGSGDTRHIDTYGKNRIQGIPAELDLEEIR